MNTTRRKPYQRKPTRGRSPHPDLRRVVRILEYLCRNATQDPNEPMRPWITKFPALQLWSEDDDPLRDHINKLKRILAKQDAREVFGQTEGSGRPAKTDEHRALADLYLSVRGLFAALAEKERQLISERTRAGLAAARERGARLGTRGRKASRQQLENAGKASAARADDFATSVRLQVEGALTKASGNLTRAALLLNESGHRSAAGRLWERRSVAAVARRLKLS